MARSSNTEILCTSQNASFNFRYYGREVKCMLFKSFYTNLYCCTFFFGMEEFYSYKEKTLQKRQSRETKYNTTKKNIYITMYNYKLYTIARLVPNKSIQAVQLIY